MIVLSDECHLRPEEGRSCAAEKDPVAEKSAIFAALDSWGTRVYAP